MRIIGIESTAHTFGVGIYDSEADALIANAKALYKAPPGEGLIPRVVADHHSHKAAEVIGQAMEQAGGGAGKEGFSLQDIGAVAYSAGPGLGACLQTGATAAAFIAEEYGIPLVPVNHCHAHYEVARWQCGYADPLALYVSGGNTQIIVGTKGSGRGEPAFGPPFRVLGETLDIGVGNLFDTFARSLDVEWAHGSVVARMAMQGKEYHELPYTVKGMNFAFSGLLTAASKKAGSVPDNDLCYSLMETAFAELCEATERALMLTRKKEIVVCGGVAQNPVLVAKVKAMSGTHGAEAGTCEGQYNADNGAMIALAGARLLEQGVKLEPDAVWVDQKWRIDQVGWQSQPVG